MSYEVELAPGGETFEVAEGETILDAALRAGIDLKYGCRHGNCSTCKYLVEDGEVDFGHASAYSLPDAEREEGWALMCCATPLTDLLIQDDRRPDARARPMLTPQDATATVTAATALTAELWELRLQLPEPFTFYAGQYAELTLDADGAPVRRSYSMASAPDGSGELAFVLKRIAGGAFSDRVTALEPGAELALRGPFGTSYLRDGERPVLFAAIGSGLAPILAMLRAAAAAGDTRAFTFYYGARRPADLPCEDELATLGGKLPGLRYVPTLDGLQDGDAWDGAVGNVTQAIQREVDNASDLDVYLCGAPEMCETVARLLRAKGLPEEQLFFDRFFAAT
ncbi:MAG: 2Fe-2S iron-sulfur cluster binding domain-containing protein [Gammaproteobacteria bacterium]|nr:2Fe-2S iron-sulfur cluster binding domain-containing protein [Gammaproteobacteria bacterium]